MNKPTSCDIDVAFDDLYSVNRWTSFRPITLQARSERTVVDAEKLSEIVKLAPVHFDQGQADLNGIGQALTAEKLDVSEVLAASWCTFGTANIEALVDAPTIAFVHSRGILATTGKRKMLGGKLKYSTVDFTSCRGYGPTEHEDPRRLGKFCIEFAGPGNILLGRLQWTWRAKRFGDSRQQIMAVAEERDRILQLVTTLLG
ncbi:hypothetical protein [Amycolatopsis sp. DG1A-15b]|uniref:hypothetical protein n=1 Tax=Amycolatopsis sp. DG1A-15b TaxID=3052846 RepID=UPI00255B8431|nr:hypothetical protein [Amycolatopsis sp. DG1A-15b]WIX85830.1 hypothetical protein QRY02_32090 [Amycolatopsis sp. DG1A-15b]